METIALILISILLGVEVYCIDWMLSYIKQRSEERTEARREGYRAVAYQEMEKRSTIKANRQKIWREYK